MKIIHGSAIHDSKYGTTCVLFASTYTAKQMKTMYYSLIIIHIIMIIKHVKNVFIYFRLIQLLMFSCQLWTSINNSTWNVYCQRLLPLLSTHNISCKFTIFVLHLLLYLTHVILVLASTISLSTLFQIMLMFME